MSENKGVSPGTIVVAAIMTVVAGGLGILYELYQAWKLIAGPTEDVAWDFQLVGLGVLAFAVYLALGVLLLRQSRVSFWWIVVVNSGGGLVAVLLTLFASLNPLVLIVVAYLAAAVALLFAGRTKYADVARSSNAPVAALVRSNIREYGMYIALLFILGVFYFTTHGIFLSSRNIADLLNQTGYIAVLAVGMTLVIVIRHIDLSVGFLAGFLGAVAAVMLVTWHWPVWLVLPSVMVLGILAGLLTSLPVARLGIPSFVASLAGWLIYRGLLLLTTSSTGTIKIDDPVFLAIGNSSIPDIVPETSAFLPGVHKLTLLLGLAAMLWFIWADLRNRRIKKSYNFQVIPANLQVVKLVLVSLAMIFITWTLAGYNGLGWTVVIVLLVVAVYDWVSRQTVLGRHIYAVGGNPEAAELSGISVSRITMIVFGSMGLLAALAGILFASRLSSAAPNAGTLFELDAIAAAYIGGVSAAGGVGKITGSLVGALVYMSLRNGMNLIGIDESVQYVIRGAVLALAVIFDVSTRRVKR